MLTTLIGSRPQESRAATGAAVSVAIHAALIVMAVVETAHSVTRPHDTPVDTPVVYFPPRPATPATRASAAPPRPVEKSTGSTEPVIREPTPTPIPTGPTRVDVSVPAPQTGSGLPVMGSADSSAGATSAAPGGGTTSIAANAPFTGDEVERAVQAIRPVPPRYPEMLRAAGVTGTVRVRFVVDSSGVVEPGSIEILDAPQAAFGDAVRRALLATRYRPAEANGQRVRQLVEQAFTFRLQ